MIALNIGILKQKKWLAASAAGLFLFFLLLTFPSAPSSYTSGTSTSTSGSSPAGKAVEISTKKISYDKTTPPTVGCESIVIAQQQLLISEYAKILKDIRYVNIWGYLETENKGDAAIWVAQQILLNMLGITTMEVCRYVDRGCDMEKFAGALKGHEHSAIVIAGGGNTNDFYWDDVPSRFKMMAKFPDVPVRSFPQSIYFTKPDKLNETLTNYGAHPDLQLCARDRPSFDFLEEHFKPQGIDTRLTPDIAFMFGDRKDIRINTPKKWDILILARDDWEVTKGAESELKEGEGTLTLPTGRTVTYKKIDWKKIPTPGINDEGHKELGKNQRAYAKAMDGFALLASSRFVITDRLHGHIMTTVLGVPHVLLDSKLKKNLNYHGTWTEDCGCVRVVDDMGEAMGMAGMFFDVAENRA
ncbi:hypothetical protein YB2330_001729 [Saitoella coloradoensis]